MKFSYKHLFASLIILAFSAKLLSPLVETYKQLIKSIATEQKEEKPAEEKETDENFQQKSKMDIAYLISAVPGLPYSIVAGTSFIILQPAFLQAQYFAVPTPPPWC